MVTSVNQEKNTKEEGNGNKQKPEKHEEKGDDSIIALVVCLYCFLPRLLLHS